MATPDPSKVRYLTGRLAHSVSSFAANSGDYPWDGTAIGLTGSVDLRLPARRRVLTHEETGAVSKVVWLGGPVIFFCRLKGWDADSIAMLPGGSSGANGPLWKMPAGNEGKVPTALSNVVFSPYNQTDPGPTLVLKNVQVVPDTARDLPLSAYRGMHLSVAMIEGARAELGHQSDVSLT